MKYRVKVEEFYECEAESVHEIEEAIHYWGLHNDKIKCYFVGNDYYAEEIKPAGTEHNYVQLDV